jgi:hypothetical protein
MRARQNQAVARSAVGYTIRVRASSGGGWPVAAMAIRPYRRNEEFKSNA